MVDRALLERTLEEGLSLAEIGRRVGRHESTVAYWMAQHGLEANGRERHAAKGAIGREQLEELCERGPLDRLKSRSSWDARRRRSASWLREYGLQTRWAERRQASKMGAGELDPGVRAPWPDDVPPPEGCRLLAARSATARPSPGAGVRSSGSSWKRPGGRVACVDMTAAWRRSSSTTSTRRRSDSQLSRRGVSMSIERARAEARKCVLLCSNCHAEVEAGVAVLTMCGTACRRMMPAGRDSPG